MVNGSTPVFASTLAGCLPFSIHDFSYRRVSQLSTREGVAGKNLNAFQPATIVSSLPVYCTILVIQCTKEAGVGGRNPILEHPANPGGELQG